MISAWKHAASPVKPCYSLRWQLLPCLRLKPPPILVHPRHRPRRALGRWTPRSRPRRPRTTTEMIIGVIVLSVHVAQPLLLRFPHLPGSRRRRGRCRGRGAIRSVGVVRRAGRPGRYGRRHLCFRRPGSVIRMVPRPPPCESGRGQGGPRTGSPLNPTGTAVIRPIVRAGRSSSVGRCTHTRTCGGVTRTVGRLLTRTRSGLGVLRHLRGVLCGRGVVVRVHDIGFGVHQVRGARCGSSMASRRVELRDASRAYPVSQSHESFGSVGEEGRKD